MAERGRARYSLIAAGSNTTVKSSPGSLYTIVSSNPSGSTIRVADALNLGTTPDFNTVGNATITNIGAAAVDFLPGIGFEALTVAATSNARITVVYE